MSDDPYQVDTPRHTLSGDNESDIDQLPLIQSMPLPVPVGHPEHPDFRGYDDDPVPDTVFDYEGDLDAVIAEVASAWGKRG